MHSTVLGRRCQPSEVSDPQSNLSPSAQPGTPLFQAGKVANVHPFRQHAPLCAHPPQGIQAQTQHLICGSLSSPGSHSETESKEKAGSGSVHTRGRRVCPITAPSPAPPRSPLPAPRRHLSPRRKGLSAGIAGTYRCGTGDEGEARQGRIGGRLPNAGAARSAVSPAGSRSSSRAGSRGALLRRLLPAPTPALGLPPRRVTGRASPTPPARDYSRIECRRPLGRRGTRGAAAAAAPRNPAPGGGGGTHP